MPFLDIRSVINMLFRYSKPIISDTDHSIIKHEHIVHINQIADMNHVIYQFIWLFATKLIVLLQRYLSFSKTNTTNNS